MHYAGNDYQADRNITCDLECCLPPGTFAGGGGHRKRLDAINVDKQREGGRMVTPPERQLA